jgi:hypothetical protein
MEQYASIVKCLKQSYVIINYSRQRHWLNIDSVLFSHAAIKIMEQDEGIAICYFKTIDAFDLGRLVYLVKSSMTMRVSWGQRFAYFLASP